MEDGFILPVSFGGKEIELPAKLFQYGYTIKIEVEIEGTKVFFEPDEERNWRAMISYEAVQANKKLNTALLELIAKELDAILK